MSLYGSVDSVAFANVATTQGPFTLKGGQYGVTVHAATWGSVTLQRLAADGLTFVTVLTAFAADGFAALGLPPGSYQILISGATGVSIDVTSIVTGI